MSSARKQIGSRPAGPAGSAGSHPFAGPGWCSAMMLCAAALLGVVTACRQPPRAETDLDAIRASGELRVIARPGFLQAPAAGTPASGELALVRQLAARLGATPRWVICRRNDQVVPWLRDGRGDLAVGRMSGVAMLDEEIRPSAPVHWVQDLLVAAPDLERAEFGALGGLSAHLQRSATTPTIRARLVEEGVAIVPVPEEVSLEEILRRVRSGRYRLTVTDSGLLEAMPGQRRIRVVGAIGERRALVWGVPQSGARLARAVDDFLFAEKVLARATRTTACRDLPLIRQSGVLRLVTRNSATTCVVERGGLSGFEYELALAFARQLKVRLELAIPAPGVEPTDWLEQGYGDLAALHEPIDPDDEGRFLQSPAYRSVDLVSVLPARVDAPADLTWLGGVDAASSRPVASLVRRMPVEPAIDARSPGAGADALIALLEVSRGRSSFAVVDSDTARLERELRPDLQLGPVIVPDVPLVWLFNPSADDLRDRASRFLAEAASSGQLKQLVHNELGGYEPNVPRRLPEVPDGDLTPYDELLRWVGREHGIDWRLLASLMYEESRFDPDAVGPGGSAGLFQFMPFTWQELGVEDPHHPAEAAEAAGWYLRWLMDRFPDLDLPDQVAMAIASYNVGAQHVFDARRLSREMNLDPNRWSGNVETAMVILDDPAVARRFSAGVCRCRRAVGYTRRILRRYRAYTEQFPPR